MLDLDDILLDNEEEAIMSRFHLGHSIYLYGVFSEADFERMYTSNNIITPIYLYESPRIAKLQADKNIQQPVCLKFAVDIEITKQKVGIDYLIPEFTPQTKEKERELQKQAGYIRRYDNKSKSIVYEIRDPHRLLQPYRAE